MEGSCEGKERKRHFPHASQWRLLGRPCDSPLPIDQAGVPSIDPDGAAVGSEGRRMHDVG